MYIGHNYGHITSTSAISAGYAIELGSDSGGLRLVAGSGDAFMQAGGAHVQCHYNTEVSIQPKLTVAGIDIVQAIKDLENRVNNLEK